MALMLSSRGILAKARELGSKNRPVRTGVVSAAAGTVGLVSGKRRDAKTTPIIAVGIGAAANLVGLTAIGDGLMAGGATLIGYKFGAPKPQMIATAPVRHQAPKKKRGLFG
jgi:hypothetical protein